MAILRYFYLALGAVRVKCDNNKSPGYTTETFNFSTTFVKMLSIRFLLNYSSGYANLSAIIVTELCNFKKLAGR